MNYSYQTHYLLNGWLLLYFKQEISQQHIRYIEHDGTNQSYLSWINIYTGSTGTFIHVNSNIKWSQDNQNLTTHSLEIKYACYVWNTVPCYNFFRQNQLINLFTFGVPFNVLSLNNVHVFFINQHWFVNVIHQQTLPKIEWHKLRHSSPTFIISPSRLRINSIDRSVKTSECKIYI